MNDENAEGSPDEDAGTGAMDEKEAHELEDAEKEAAKDPEDQAPAEGAPGQAVEEKPEAMTPAQVDAAVKTELTLGGEIQPIIPKSLSDLAQYAAAFVKANMVPENLTVHMGGGKGGPIDLDATKAKVMLVIAKGLEVKIAPQMAVANIMVVNNRTTIWGDLVRSLVMRSKLCEGWHEYYELDGEIVQETVEIADGYTAVCELKRKGYDELWVGRFSCAQAKKAGLWMNPKKDPWMKYPVGMLMWRARTYAVRAGFSDVLGGLAIMEEMEDITPTEPVDDSFLDGEVEKVEATPAQE